MTVCSGHIFLSFSCNKLSITVSHIVSTDGVGADLVKGTDPSALKQHSAAVQWLKAELHKCAVLAEGVCGGL